MLGLNNVTGTCLQILSVAINHSITFPFLGYNV